MKSAWILIFRSERGTGFVVHFFFSRLRMGNPRAFSATVLLKYADHSLPTGHFMHFCLLIFQYFPIPTGPHAIFNLLVFSLPQFQHSFMPILACCFSCISQSQQALMLIFACWFFSFSQFQQPFMPILACCFSCIPQFQQTLMPILACCFSGFSQFQQSFFP